jgi:hypothetical protein
LRELQMSLISGLLSLLATLKLAYFIVN